MVLSQHKSLKGLYYLSNAPECQEGVCNSGLGRPVWRCAHCQPSDCKCFYACPWILL